MPVCVTLEDMHKQCILMEELEDLLCRKLLAFFHRPVIEFCLFPNHTLVYKELKKTKKTAKTATTDTTV